ncbi:MAG: S8 family serine peptidase [Chloroflexi bacterium]|nr:S8 family serine peptidase [Chloroflexota bacterium]
MSLPAVSRIVVPLAVLAVLGVLAGPATAASPEVTERADYAAGEVVVRLSAESPYADSARLASQVGATVERVSARGGFATLLLPPGQEAEAIERLLADPAVESAELNALKQPSRIPVDEFFPLQWNMKLIGAPEAWNTSFGSGVTIAVLDTGVAYENYNQFGRSPGLSQTRFVSPYDATDGTTHANDEDGHGTHVTGTLAQDWDAFGVAGLVPQAAIMPVRVCRPSGCSADSIADGVYWAVDHGADVINLSLGGPVLATIEREAFAYAEAAGVVVVAAAGNGGGDLIGDPTLDFPARMESVVSVGALDRNMERARYSSYGEHEGDDGLHLMGPGGIKDVSGNGDGILQNTYAFTCGAGPEDYKQFALCSYFGTSMATPHVSGIAAMLLSVHPDLSAAQVRGVLRCASLDLGDPGYDAEYGAGMLFAPAAIADQDEDGIVDCFDARPALTASIAKVDVRPGETVSVPLDISAWWPGVTSYEVQVSFSPAVVEAVGCTPREETVCVIEDDLVTVSGSPSSPLAGNFRPAYIDFEASGGLNTFTSLHVVVTAVSARVPDIGLRLFTEDGSIRISDPGPTLAGDLDCDSKVGPDDVIDILRAVGGSAEALCFAQGDVNCSGGVDAFDGLAIIAYIAEIAHPAVADCPEIGSSLAPESEEPE